MISTIELPKCEKLVIDRKDTMGLLIDEGKECASRALSESTQYTYQTYAMRFQTWCYSMGVASTPALPETIVAYLMFLANESRLKISSIKNHRKAIAHLHNIHGHHLDLTHPMIHNTWLGLMRTIGVKQHAVKALDCDTLHEVIAAIPKDTIRGIRDRALLLMGWYCAFRQSELVSIHVKDVTYHDEGIKIFLRRSKTDVYGQGETKAIKYHTNIEKCAIHALKAWLELAQITTGPLFRGVDNSCLIADVEMGKSQVAIIIRRRMKEYYIAQGYGVKKSSELADKYAGHSLRRGFVTSTYLKGATDAQIMKTTGHKSVQNLLRYKEDVDTFKGLAADRLMS